jgi:hypothetical protein
MESGVQHKIKIGFELLLKPMLATGFILSAFAVSSAQSSSVLNSSWSGQAQCTVNVQGPGYSEHEVHTWNLSGGAPTLQGAMHVFQGTWSVTGQGSLQRSQGSQTYLAQWNINASRPNATIAIFVRASDRRIIIKSWHAQLRSPGGVTGTQQITIKGVPQTPGKINLEAFEWQFPADGSAIASVTTDPHFSGSRTSATNGSVGPMQPGGSQGTAQCSWQFAGGGGSLLTPATP